MHKLTFSALAGALAAVPLVFGTAGPADAQRVLKLHHQLPPNSPVQKIVLEPFAKAVEQATDGQLRIQIYPLMQLGGTPQQIYDQTKDGVVDIGWSLPGYTAGRFPLSALFELPFMVTTAEATSLAFDEMANKHFVPAEYTDTHPLMFHVSAAMKFHMRNAPIVKVEDFQGRKVRATHKAMGDSLASFGATPIFMPVPQVPQSLQRGVIDGCVLPWEVVVPLKIYELVEYHSTIEGGRGFIVPAFVLAMNKRVYESLPQSQRQAIENATDRDFVREVGIAYDKVEQVGYNLAKERGNKFNVIAPAQVERMIEMTEPVRQAWIANVTAKGFDGKRLMAEANELINKYTTQ